MSEKKRVKRRVGDVVSIPLGSHLYGFAIVLEDPLFGYFDYRSSRPDPPLAEVVAARLAFKVWTMKHEVVRGNWPIIGRINEQGALAERPWFYKEDPLTHRLSKTRDGSEELPVTEEEVMTMERAAVWEPIHVVDRLRDHFAGVPNKWVESMKPGQHKGRPPAAT
jgi:Immunity protein 26